jgi:Na+-driven multidrug efflux pump
MLMGVWGWWAFDIFTLMASYMNEDVIGAQTILRSVGLITYMLPLGIANSCSIMVGNAIGEGSEYKARLYYRTC